MAGSVAPPFAGGREAVWHPFTVICGVSSCRTTKGRQADVGLLTQPAAPARLAPALRPAGYTLAPPAGSAMRGVEAMLVVTTENVPGHRVKDVKGQVFGVVVRSRGLGGNIMAGLRSLAGGEITEYTQLLEEARRHAVDRMVKNATLMQANAIVMMRFDSAEIGQTMSEIVAYGTAVVLEKASG
jgi:uncharacterized protein YbjQ (UPF0145 family)